MFFFAQFTAFGNWVFGLFDICGLQGGGVVIIAGDDIRFALDRELVRRCPFAALRANIRGDMMLAMMASLGQGLAVYFLLRSLILARQALVLRF